MTLPVLPLGQRVAGTAPTAATIPRRSLYRKVVNGLDLLALPAAFSVSPGADDLLDAAAMVLGSQTGKVERFVDAWSELQKALREAGADPSRAANPD